jgi:hypothetical protein
MDLIKEGTTVSRRDLACEQERIREMRRMIFCGIGKSGKANGLEDDASERLLPVRWQEAEGMGCKNMQNVSEKGLKVEEYLIATYWG